MEHGLAGDTQFGAAGQMQTGIEIPVEAREVAAGHLNADPVSFEEGPGCCPAIDTVRVSLTGFQQNFLIESVEESATQETVAEVDGSAVGSDIAHFDGKVGIFSVCCGIDHGFDIADHIQVFRQRFAGENENIGP